MNELAPAVALQESSGDGLTAGLGRRRWRPSFMAVTVVIALVLSHGSSLVAHQLSGASGSAEDDVYDRRARHEMLERGWVPVVSGPALLYATALEQSQAIELMQAERDFRVPLLSGEISGSAPGESELVAAAEVVAAELGRYPPGALARARLRRVVLCGALFEQAEPIPSLPNLEQTLILDAESSSGFLRRVIHHEVFHFVDYAEDDQVKSDPAWEVLNDRWFVYGSGGRYVRQPGSAELSEALPGFLSRYSRSALEEDKAEVFSFMMTAPRAVERIARRDRVVAAKTRAIRARVAQQLPSLDVGFWDAVRDGRR